MSRYARRVDGPHGKVRHVLRQLGWTVIDTSRFGNGFPDLVCWRADGRAWFIEVKTAKGKLRADQEAFAASCPRYVVLRSEQEAADWAIKERRAA